MWCHALTHCTLTAATVSKALYQKQPTKTLSQLMLAVP